MLEVYPEVSEFNEFEKVLRNTNFKNPYDKKRAVKDYENLLELRERINATLPKEHNDYEWLNKVSNIQLTELFTSQELLRDIIIVMNAGVKNLE